jgi:hypothetical protein
MDKIVLVVGEVTRNQYQPARYDILRDASTPKLQRVESNDLLWPDLMLERIYGDQTELRKLLSVGDDDDFAQRSLGPLEQYYLGLARKHLQKFGHVRALVVQEDLLVSGYNSVIKLLQQTPQLASLWSARSDGSVVKFN